MNKKMLLTYTDLGSNLQFEYLGIEKCKQVSYAQDIFLFVTWNEIFLVCSLKVHRVSSIEYVNKFVHYAWTRAQFSLTRWMSS